MLEQFYNFKNSNVYYIHCMNISRLNILNHFNLTIEYILRTNNFHFYCNLVENFRSQQDNRLKTLVLLCLYMTCLISFEE